MKNRIVNVPAIRTPITRSPGFEKKCLAEYKLDLLALCGFGCRYCSSNRGNYLRINRTRLVEMTEEQLGTQLLPEQDPDLTILWPDVLERLRVQLDSKKPSWGHGKTLVFSMLTDGFSPLLVQDGTTEKALRLVLERTSFRIRVLTKNATVGSRRWIEFFKEHPGRFIVGLSTGTSDDEWSRRVEVGTSLPSARFRALAALQDAGIPTYGMLCPVFPDMLGDRGFEDLIDKVRPDRVEHFWAEPFNDRQNWKHVRDGFSEDSHGFRWLTQVYDQKRGDVWSNYAAQMYRRLRSKAMREGWIHKLRYLLYEGSIKSKDTLRFGDLQGVLLQGKPGPDGLSTNPYIASLQCGGSVFDRESETSGVSV